MEDNLRMVALEDFAHTLDDAYIADDGHEIQIGESLLEFETDIMERGLAIVEKDKLADLHARQLAAQLAADAACGS